MADVHGPLHDILRKRFPMTRPVPTLMMLAAVLASGSGVCRDAGFRGPRGGVRD